MIFSFRAKHIVSCLAWFIFPFSIGIGLICLYSSALPNQYTSANQSADAGDLLTAVLTGGVPHPTGYPTYLLIAELFQKLPFGTAIYKGAFLSSVFASLTVLLISIFVLSRKETNKAPNGPSPTNNQENLPVIIASIAASLALGVSPYYWSQAIIVEVYALQTFFTALFLFWIKQLQYPHGKQDFKLDLLSISLGLGLGNHITLLLLFPAVFFIARNTSFQRLLKSLILVAIPALLIYVVLLFRASAFPPINWGNPQDFPGLVWLVSGRLYHGLAFGLPLSSYPGRIAYWAGWWFTQFGPIGVLLAISGAIHITEGSRFGLAELWIFVVSSLFSIGYLTNDSLVYLLPAVIIFSIWLGDGIRLALALQGRFSLISRLVVILFFIFLVLRIPDTYHAVDPRQDKKSSEFINRCLGELPNNALLITETDDDTFPIWYAIYGLHQRTDIAVIARGLLNFAWYQTTLRHTYPTLILPETDANNWDMQLSMLNHSRAVCKCPIQSGSALCTSK
jgi:hypothetical protein